MRIVRNPDGTPIGLVVSRRNLLSMIAKLDGHPNPSANTLIYDGFYLAAEENELHYSNPERDTSTPGRAHPDTETTINDTEFLDRISAEAARTRAEDRF